ncbi:Serine/threonine-protein phosphatase 6 regulatory ankyrin repeat subunit C [Pseudolycoriella hygida]|uniref:Serine/threonine-protein phosphatase 6 regulatory ankyrin repeat subunit C n=1 Tax=Pseudolycoriella hygida TaxID=35572 RepID=A0A9Q0N7Z5_9DIPT|nr:Serine/threonine-protein phosphatase 6 regulatory ankyrin repeat subunit C [Pseudolycoriella hygida]
MSKNQHLEIAQLEKKWRQEFALIKQGRHNGKAVWKLLEQFSEQVGLEETTRRYLPLAIKLGSLRVVDFFLEAKTNLTMQDQHGRTPLHLVLKNKHILQKHEGNAIALKLLSHTNKAFMDIQDKIGRTPLSYAAEAGYEDAVVSLTNYHKVGVDIPDKSGRTPLSYAAEKGNDSISDILIKQGADINTPDKKGRTPLSYAAASVKSGNYKIINLLIKKGADLNIPDKDGRTPLSYAAAAVHPGNYGIINLLIKEGASLNIPDKNGRTPLSYAVNLGLENIAELELSVKSGAEIDKKLIKELKKKEQGLKVSELQAMVEQEFVLIKQGNHDTKAALGLLGQLEQRLGPLGIRKVISDYLALAVESGSSEIVSFLFKQEDAAGLVFFIEPETIYRNAVMRLTRKEQDVNAQDINGKTILSHAASKDNYKLAELLIKQGAQIELQNKNGCTPLYYAALAGCNDIAELLIGSGAKINEHVLQGLKKETIVNGIKEYSKKEYDDITKRIQYIDNNIAELSAINSDNLAIMRNMQDICQDLRIYSRSLKILLPRDKAAQANAESMAKGLAKHTAPPTKETHSSSILSRIRKDTGTGRRF